MHGVVWTQLNRYILQCSKSPQNPFLEVLLASFPRSLGCHSGRLSSASKNLSLKKTVTPPSLGCNLSKQAKLPRTELTHALHQLYTRFGNRRRTACLHVRAQICDYWLLCREAEALMLARSFSGVACLVCLLQKMSLRGIQPSLCIYWAFPSHSPNSPYSCWL